MMLDLQILAFRSDLTRVITLAFGREATYRTFPEVGIFDGHHALSHHQNDAAKLDKLAKIQTYHSEAFARSANRDVRSSCAVSRNAPSIW